MKIGRLRARLPLVLLILSGATSWTLPAADSKAPVITQQPVNQMAERWGTARFTVTATGTLPLTYQWYRDGRTFEGWNQRTINLHTITENDVGTYRVTVSNAAGSVISEGVRLTLAGTHAPAVAESRPAETKPPPVQPEPKPEPKPAAPPQTEGTETLTAGQKFQLLATAEGSPPFKFQWMKNGTPIKGATNATFAIPQVQPSDAGVYVCIVSNSAGSNPSAPLTLVVQKP